MKCKMKEEESKYIKEIDVKNSKISTHFVNQIYFIQ